MALKIFHDQSPAKYGAWAGIEHMKLASAIEHATYCATGPVMSKTKQAKPSEYIGGVEDHTTAQKTGIWKMHTLRIGCIIEFIKRAVKESSNVRLC